MAFRKEDEPLRNEINRVIVEMKEDGTLAALPGKVVRTVFRRYPPQRSADLVGAFGPAPLLAPVEARAIDWISPSSSRPCPGCCRGLWLTVQLSMVGLV